MPGLPGRLCPPVRARPRLPIPLRKRRRNYRRRPASVPSEGTPTVTTRRWFTRKNITVLGLATAGFLAAVAGPASAAHAAEVPPPAKLLAVDFQLQENGYYCGPSATRVALSAQGKTYTQDQVAQKLGTTPNGTDSINQVTS